MPRYARVHAPGSLVHVISRFVNRQYRLAGATERQAFLERLPWALARADWTLLGYALMSSHVHLALVAGQAPAWHFLKPLHTAIARWLNTADRALGQVFAERATTVHMELSATAHLLAYLHNNPVRAHVVSSAEQSGWTSHRAYLDPAHAPPWLAVEQGLALCGLDADEAGCAEFHRLVCSHAGHLREPALSGSNLGTLRRQVRRATGLPLEVSSPVLGLAVPLLPACALLLPAQHRAPASWNGDLAVLLDRVCHQSGVTIAQLCARGRQPHLVAARRLAVVAGCRLLLRPVREVAASLGLSPNAATKLLRRSDQVIPVAQDLVSGLWDRTSG